MRTTIKQAWYSLVCCMLLGFLETHAQLVNDQDRLGITLSDGTQVVLFGEAASLSDRRTKRYRALPTNLRLAQNPEGYPEFLFLKYMTDEKLDNGGINGALLHMLMHWGLTPEQRTELEQILKKGEQGAPSGSKYLGAMEVKPDGDRSLKIISATMSDEKLARSIVQSFSAPVLEGGRSAVASSLSAEGAQLMAAAFERDMAIADLSVELSYRYTTRIPAAKGRVTVNWSKMQQEYSEDFAEYKSYSSKKRRGGIFGGLGDVLFGRRSSLDSVSYDEARSVIDSMVEKEYIKIDWDENLVDSRIEKVREAFFDFFLKKMTASTEMADLVPPTKKEKEAMPNIKYGKKYTFNRSYLEKSFKKGKQVYRLDLRLAVEKPFTVTGNLASWYNGVKDNEKCVTSIILNDPFFQHRDINFILDNEAKALLETGEANYATVNIKKERDSENDFESYVTIDYEHLKKEGLKASVSYARGNDTNSDGYKYKTQWSLKGGNLYPQEPQWIDGDWEGVTLAPPIVPRTIEFEADLEELRGLGITRATLQLRYSKFGNEVETNIPITVSKGEPLTEKTIFTDRDTQGYAYRYILNHKEQGKMVIPPNEWEVKINDDYVYATIPSELKDEDPDYLEKIVRAGEVILKPGSDGKVTKAAEILDKFKDVISVVKSEEESK
ncbi:MAG: hypothetical protein AAGF77_00025 [Bacteroidota bacterium]